MIRRLLTPPLFPYTTLFRSVASTAIRRRAGYTVRDSIERLMRSDLSSMIDADGNLRTLGYDRSEEHTSELQSLRHLVCRLLLEKKKKDKQLQKLSTKRNNKR